MRPLRQALRAAALLFVTGKLLLLYACAAPFTAGRAERRRRLQAFVLRTWGRAVLAVLSVEVEEVGSAPDGPFLLVANHVSYLDVPLLASRLDAVFVAKAEVERWPLVGAACRRMGTLFVDRERPRDALRVLGEIEALLAAGVSVVLFPEATSTDGAAVAPFRSPLLAAAARSGTGVAWAALGYATPSGEPAARRAVCWWGDMPFTPHLLRLLALPRIHARLRFGDERIADGDRKRLAHRLHEAVSHGHEPLWSPM